MGGRWEWGGDTYSVQYNINGATATAVGLRGLHLPRVAAVLLSQHHPVSARGARWAAWDFDAAQYNRFQAQRE